MSARFVLGPDSNNRLNSVSASGQALPLTVVVLALAAVTAFLLASLGGEVLRAARSQAAADTSALAGAGAGERAARRVAERNGAELLSFTQKDTHPPAVSFSAPATRAPSVSSPSASSSVSPAAVPSASVEVEVRREGWNSFAAAGLGSLKPLTRSVERRFPPGLTASPLEADPLPAAYSQPVPGSQSAGYSPAS